MVRRSKPNQNILAAIKSRHVLTYEFAESLGSISNTFLLHLRQKLSAEEHSRVMKVISK